MNATPAGWYADPHGQAKLRYWDGSQWTEHTSNEGGGQAQQPQQQQSPAPAAFGAAPGGAVPAGGSGGGGKSGGGRKRILAIVGGIVGLLVIAFVLLAIFGPRTWDAEEGERDIKAAIPTAEEVDCPDGESADKGNRFDCTVTVAGGQEIKVTLEIVDDEGRANVVSVGE